MMWFNQKIRALHKWLGLLLFPWVIAYGLTGFYMNHSRWVLDQFPDDQFDSLRVDDQPGALTSPEDFRDWVLASPYKDQLSNIVEKDYHDKPAWIITLKDKSQVIVFKDSSQYALKNNYRRLLLDENGDVLDREIYWGGIFKELHARGMVASPFSTLFADIFSFILVGFGVSGLLVWGFPKIMRAKARWTRRHA